MASQAFRNRGGSEAEYRIWRALYSTGRKEPEDFVFNGGGQSGPSFFVFSPNVGLRIVNVFDLDAGLDTLQSASSGLDVKLIQENEALSGPDRAVRVALGG